ncbi:MAG TPA: hypothetical protein VEA80_09060 [Vitreimonas sp.]|uniref:hypothetical protein n=1 Tax=Vitreimonas sp. TaxID=3069702 RepID=UPI002D6BEEA9|nr:hypothetical protein [Vitreimonas sp.]HYD87610.1 hypothetical protein [Vitreimonas sp.]
MIVPPVSVLAAAPWLKQQPDGTALMLTGLAATLTIIASFALAMLQDRQIDEWQRSNARFSVQWGWATGSALVALLLALPPIHDLILSGAAVWGGEPNPDQQLVLLTFTFGFLAVVVAQALCTALLSFGWHVWMSRAPREPS